MLAFSMEAPLTWLDVSIVPPRLGAWQLHLGSESIAFAWSRPLSPTETIPSYQIKS